jgi:hypothetical protein
MSGFKTVLKHASYVFGSRLLSRLLFTVFVIWAMLGGEILVLQVLTSIVFSLGGVLAMIAAALLRSGGSILDWQARWPWSYTPPRSWLPVASGFRSLIN